MDFGEGPFIRDHPVFMAVWNQTKDLFEPFVSVSRQYETGGSYGGFWATLGKDAALRRPEAEAQAEKIRTYVNKLVGYSLMAKPEYTLANADHNPYTSDAVCFCLVPKSIADRNERFGGDAMLGALVACVEAGAFVK